MMDGHSLLIVIVSGVVSGVIVGLFCIWRNRKNATIALFTIDDALKYARDMKVKYPEAVSTMITLVINEKTGKKTIVQTILDEHSNIIKKNSEEIAGRMFQVQSICQKLNDLLDDDTKCTITL